jgi:ribonuclease J
MVRLAPGRAEVIDEVPAGRIYLDGGFMTPEDGEPLRERRHAATSGVLHAALVMDGRGCIASGPQVRAIGLPGDPERPLEDLLDDLADAAEAAIRRLDGDQREIDAEVEAAMSRALKKASQRIWGRRPVVQSTVLRL